MKPCCGHCVMISLDMAEGQAIHPSPCSLNDDTPGNEAMDPLTSRILPWLPKLAPGSITQTISGQLPRGHRREFSNFSLSHFWSNTKPWIIKSGQVMFSVWGLGWGRGQLGVQHIGRAVEVHENASSLPTSQPWHHPPTLLCPQTLQWASPVNLVNGFLWWLLFCLNA